MKITGYRSMSTTHRWGRPVGDANGAIRSGVTEVAVLLLLTDGGVTGVGLGGHAEVDRVFPALEGEDPRAVTALYDRMLSYVFKAGHAGATFGAIGVLDMALWDIKAKLAGEPLWRTLGGRDRFVPGYASALEFAVEDDALPSLYEPWVDRGFVSAKVKGGLDPERDISRLRAVGEMLTKNTTAPALMLDVNENWGPHQARRFLGRIEDEIDLTWVEEPVRRWDVAGNLAVARSARAAVATGENLTGLEQYRPLLDAGAVGVVQAGCVWGITHFLRVATLALAHDLPISPVGYHGNVLAHAATAVPNHLVCELQDLSSPMGVTVDQTIEEGGVRLGDAPGLGIEIDEAAIGSDQETVSWADPAGPHVRPGDAGLRLTASRDGTRSARLAERS